MLQEAGQKSRRRGRPPGQAKIVRSAGLRLHDLAFLRAVVQGMRSNAAAKRYLVDLSTDERFTKRYVETVASEAINLLLGIKRRDLATNLRGWLARFKGPEPAQQSHEMQPEVSEQEGGQEPDPDTLPPESLPGSEGPFAVETLPTLEQFIEERELEDFSESEALDLYLGEYGEHFKTRAEAKAEEEARAKAQGQIDQAVPAQAASAPAPLPPAVPVLAVLAAIGEVQARSVVVPKRADPISTWFGKSLVKRLAGVQLRTLGDLCEFVRKHGTHWYRRVEGLGRSRGERIGTWLEAHHEQLGFSRVSAALAMAPPLVPAGATGMLQTSGPNALGATSDREALTSWLATLDFLSIHTKRAYSRDVHRLLAWAHIELGKGLSDVTVRDAVAHARFLQSPPDRWIAVPGQRSATGVGMRGALAPSSAARALAAIGHFYGFLVETGYLSANPFSRIRSPQDRGVQMDVQRSFSNGHLQTLQVVLQDMPPSARKRRIVAILALLETTGLRIGEIPSSWDAVVMVSDKDNGQVQCLKVVGKGGRERLLPLREETLDALRVHRADQIPSEDAKKPLIGLIEAPPNAASPAAQGDLSTGRIRVVIKDFFALVAEHPECPEEFVEDFKRATPHFIRHTFAHRVLAATNQDLAVTQQLLGHKSISTTGIYVKAGIGQRAHAIAALQPISTAAVVTPVEAT